jgi:hypothetical protein
MAIITIPAAVAASVGGQTYGQLRHDMEERSEQSGATAARLWAPPQWTMSITSKRGCTLAEAGAWEAMILKLRGRINHLALYDFLRQAPQGTMRGTPRLTVAAPLAAGSSSATLENMIGTLKAGDWLQFGSGLGSHLVKVSADVDSSVTVSASASWTTTTPSAANWTTSGAAAATWNTAGSAVVEFEPPTRTEIAAQTAVTWDKPVGHYKLATERNTWNAAANGPAVEGFALDLVEQPN